MGAKILVVDDEKHIVELLKYNLEKNKYIVGVAYDGFEALEKIKKERFDLVLLDLMLPKIHGIDVCKQLNNNEETAKIPIIMLTAKSSEMDKVTGLEIGADDYITKPFSVREVLARVKAVLRRSRTASEKSSNKIIKIDNINIDLESYEVTKN